MPTTRLEKASLVIRKGGKTMLDKRRLFILIAALVGAIAIAFAVQAWLTRGPSDIAASPIVAADQVVAYRRGGDV